MAKVSVKSVLKRAEARAKREWTLVSYSIDSDVLKDFKEVCRRRKLSGSNVVEEFMKDFLKVVK